MSDTVRNSFPATPASPHTDDQRRGPSSPLQNATNLGGHPLTDARESSFQQAARASVAVPVSTAFSRMLHLFRQPSTTGESPSVNSTPPAPKLTKQRLDAWVHESGITRSERNERKPVARIIRQKLSFMHRVSAALTS